MENRKYERINLPETAKIYATDSKGEKLGPVRVLGLGGLLVDTKRAYKKGDHQEIAIVDDSEGIRRKLKTIALYSIPIGVGFQFEKLDEQGAIELGVIIGKHHSARAAKKT